MSIGYNRFGIILAAAAVLQCFASCGSSSIASGENVLAAVPGAKVSESEFAEKNFEKDEFKFLIYDDSATDYIDDYIWLESSNGDVIGDAVIERNRNVQKRYNVTVTADRVESPRAEALARMNSGQCDFDVIYEWGTRLASLALDGMLYDFLQLDEPDYTQSYWLPEAVSDLTVAGKMFVTTNYITMNSFGWADLILYNRELESSLDLSDSVYELVRDGKWTFDAYVSRAIAAKEDLDNDGIMSTADRFGIWDDVSGCLQTFVTSAGITSTEKQSDGSYKLGMYNETMIDIYSRYKKQLDSSDTFISYSNVWNEKIDLSDYKSRLIGARHVMFAKDHVLFMPATLEIMREFNCMGDDCAIAPNPKYNESQERYYHFVDCKAPMMALPAQLRDADMTGTILEYMAYISEKRVLPAYYDDILAFHDETAEQNREMIDIVRNSVKYQWTSLYGLSRTNSISRKMLASGTFSTVYTKMYDAATAEIDKVMSTLYHLG